MCSELIPLSGSQWRARSWCHKNPVWLSLLSARTAIKPVQIILFDDKQASTQASSLWKFVKQYSNIASWCLHLVLSWDLNCTVYKSTEIAAETRNIHFIIITVYITRWRYYNHAARSSTNLTSSGNDLSINEVMQPLSSLIALTSHRSEHYGFLQICVRRDTSQNSCISVCQTCAICEQKNSEKRGLRAFVWQDSRM